MPQFALMPEQPSFLAIVGERLLTRFGPQADEARYDPVSQLIRAMIGSRTTDEVSGAAFLQYRSDVKLNTQVADSEIMQQMAGFGATAQSQLNSLPIPNKPSGIGLGLEIAGNAASALGAYDKNTPYGLAGPGSNSGLNSSGYRMTGAGPGASNNNVVATSDGQSSWWTKPLWGD